MKKRIIILTMLVVIMFSLAGCKIATQQSEEEPQYSMFIKLETGVGYDVVYHKETKVMYAISRGGYNQGTFTILLNADGKPMLYESK